MVLMSHGIGVWFYELYRTKIPLFVNKYLLWINKKKINKLFTLTALHITTIIDTIIIISCYVLLDNKAAILTPQTNRTRYSKRDIPKQY